MTPKMLPASWFLVYLFKRFICFIPVNSGSLGQRAAKLLSVKLWEGFDPGRSRTRAEWFKWCRSRPADFLLRPPTLTASNFKALWPTDPIFTAFKDLNLSKKCTKNQEAGSILRVIFALSKWPHLHRVYLIRVQHSLGITVVNRHFSRISDRH